MRSRGTLARGQRPSSNSSTGRVVTLARYDVAHAPARVRNVADAAGNEVEVTMRDRLAADLSHVDCGFQVRIGYTVRVLGHS